MKLGDIGIGDCAARGQGLGTAAMNRVAALADETGVDTVYRIEPTVREEPQMAWFERFGFVCLDEGELRYEPVERGAAA